MLWQKKIFDDKKSRDKIIHKLFISVEPIDSTDFMILYLKKKIQKLFSFEILKVQI